MLRYETQKKSKSENKGASCMIAIAVMSIVCDAQISRECWAAVPDGFWGSRRRIGLVRVLRVGKLRGCCAAVPSR